MRIRTLIALLFAASGLAVPAKAQWHSPQTLMLGTSLDGSITNLLGFSEVETAQGFTSPFSFVMTSAKIHTRWACFTPCPEPTLQNGFGGYFAWALYESAGGDLPGRRLRNGLVVPTVPGGRDLSDPEYANDYWTFPLPSLRINAGKQYFLSVRNTDATGAFFDVYMLWQHGFADTLVFPAAAYRLPDGTWRAAGATDDPDWSYGNRVSLEMHGYAVPEPGTLALLSVGFVGLALAARRRTADGKHKALQGTDGLSTPSS
ncbi:MAG: PEP-CTERM sorting domain-containing protein [Gemmatimonadaceae bacterium]|nr:PEP-CTERM sorting domain-containing protein [Gemmatimonadaceae bacterium]